MQLDDLMQVVSRAVAVGKENDKRNKCHDTRQFK